MIAKTLTLAFLPLAVAGGAWLRPVLAPQGDHAAGIAVVDLDRVSKGYPGATQQFEEFRRAAAALDERLQKEEQAVKALQAESSGYEPLTQAWSDARAKYEGAKAALEAMARAEQGRMQRINFEIKEKVYRDMDRAIDELAAKRQLQLVLRLRPKPGESLPLDDRLQQWSERDVLWAGSTLDITDDVIKLLIGSASDKDK